MKFDDESLLLVSGLACVAHAAHLFAAPKHVHELCMPQVQAACEKTRCNCSWPTNPLAAVLQAAAAAVVPTGQQHQTRQWPFIWSTVPLSASTPPAGLSVQLCCLALGGRDAGRRRRGDAHHLCL